MDTKWIRRAGSRPEDGEPVVLQLESMLGTFVFEVARYIDGEWWLENGERLGRPDWIRSWSRVPPLPPNAPEPVVGSSQLRSSTSFTHHLAGPMPAPMEVPVPFSMRSS